MSQRKKLLWVAAGCGAGIILCAVLGVVLLGLGGGLAWWAVKDPENVVIDVDVPTTVTRGEPFVIEVRVENTAAESQSLNSIDITKDYLAGITIEQTDPSFIESYTFSLGEVEWQSYTFKQDIAPNDTLVMQFEAVGVSTGHFAGEMDVCINMGSRCLTFLCRTVVED